MLVENDKGKLEPLIDSGSYAAGYRQAVLDIYGPRDEKPSLFPLLFLSVLFMVLLVRLIHATD